MLAITDHDTTSGWAAAASALPPGLSLVRGAEISCVRGGISLHLLAYLFDPAEPVLAGALARLRAARAGRARRMAELLEAGGTGVTWERVQQLAEGTVGRPHLASALIEQGHVGSMAEAFTPEWIGSGGRFWVPKAELDAVEAVRLVVGAGGVAVFAHPAAAARGPTVGDDVVAELARAGLAGLEVEHPDHDDRARVRLHALAGELELLVTGSSDFHGGRKPVALGEHVTAEPAYERLVAGASGVPVLAA